MHNFEKAPAIKSPDFLPHRREAEQRAQGGVQEEEEEEEEDIGNPFRPIEVSSHAMSFCVKWKAV